MFDVILSVSRRQRVNAPHERTGLGDVRAIISLTFNPFIADDDFEHSRNFFSPQIILIITRNLNNRFLDYNYI